MSEDFTSYRRDVKYYPYDETPISPLIEERNFITNKKSWGYQFRFGFFEIPEHDFQLIKSKMLNKNYKSS